MIKSKNLERLLIVVVTLFIGNFFLTWTVYNPAVATKAYRWLTSHHLLESYLHVRQVFGDTETVAYPVVSIGRLQAYLFWEARAAVVGTVVDTQKILDGDYHINIKDEPGAILVTEFVPEFPLPLPAVGEHIKIWGIARYDLANRWWEIHPVFGWEKVP